MKCLEAHEQLQRRLDGEAPPDSAELEQHLSACAPCRELFDASTVFLEGVRNLPRPPASAALIERIVSSVQADRRVRIRAFRVRVAVTAALAASLLLMALAGFLWLPEGSTPTPNPNLASKETPSEIAKSMDDARDAVRSLTERLADQTAQQAKLLLAAAGPVDLGQIVNDPSIPQAGEAAQTLRQAGQGLSDGLEPIARSTRRALQFFAREVATFDAVQD